MEFVRCASRQRPGIVCMVAAVILPLFFSVAQGAWPTDPTINLPVCVRTQIQAHPVAVSDGAGGVIVAWMDARNQGYDIYVQRIAVDGSVMWTVNGVPLCTAAGEQEFPKIVPDGQGGAIVVWEDRRLGADVFAQRVDASGVAQWDADGIAVAQAPAYENEIQAIADGFGGAIVSWTDGRDGLPDIYAQRVDAAGDTLWALNGVGVCTEKDHHHVESQLTSDGSGGALIAWRDGRVSSNSLYIQRINAGGTPAWTVDGIAVTDTNVSQDQQHLVADGSGGAIITWSDQRAGAISIYAQRIVDGLRTWDPNGVPVCTVPEGADTPRPVADGSGGIIVAWYDYRAGDANIYAQRLSANGAVLWPVDGVAVCADPGEQIWPSVGSDGFGGAIIAWQDYRNAASTGADIYTRRITGDGTMFWTVDGVAISTADEMQFRPVVVPDGMGGAILAWQDQRGDTGDIYGQHIGSNGQLGDLVAVTINDFAARPTGGGVELTWEVFADEPIAGFQIYRRKAGDRETNEVIAARFKPSQRHHVDEAVSSGEEYLYTLAVQLTDGKEARSAPVAVSVPMCDVTLEQNVPNPFNPGTIISFVLPRAGAATLAIYNGEGRLVRVLEQGPLPEGRGESYWDGRDGRGNFVSSGIYFSRLTFGKATLSQKMLLLK